MLHSAVHAARPDIRCAIYVGCSPVVAVSALKVGLLPLTQDAAVLGEVTLHKYTGGKKKLIKSFKDVVYISFIFCCSSS